MLSFQEIIQNVSINYTYLYHLCYYDDQQSINYFGDDQ